MPTHPFLIALDGPVSAGKSSLADAVARRLGILHLDTGAMYRAVGLAALRAGIDPGDEAAVTEMLRKGAVDIDVRFEEGRQSTWLNGERVDQAIRSQEAGGAASAVSRYRGVRRFLVQQQQALARSQSMIIDGRDIGTVVLPQAGAKIFLTASPETRARRRLEQIREKEPGLSYEAVLAELTERDRQDRERSVDPLRQAEDAVLLDTSELSFEQSVEAILDIVEAAYGKR